MYVKANLKRWCPIHIAKCMLRNFRKQNNLSETFKETEESNKNKENEP